MLASLILLMAAGGAAGSDQPSVRQNTSVKKDDSERARRIVGDIRLVGQYRPSEGLLAHEITAIRYEMRRAIPDDVSGFVVYLEGKVDLGRSSQPSPVVMRMTEDGWMPGFAVVEVGQRIVIKREVDWSFPTIMSPLEDYGRSSMELTRVFKEAHENVTVEDSNCGCYPMGFICVVPNRYHTRSDKAGRFTLEGVPFGEYNLRAYHPRYGGTSKRIVVRPADGEFRPTLEISRRVRVHTAYVPWDPVENWKPQVDEWLRARKRNQKAVDRKSTGGG